MPGYQPPSISNEPTAPGESTPNEEGNAPSAPATAPTSGPCTGPTCFVAGTLVQMADGSTMPIEKVVVGQKVYSRNDKTGKLEVKTVIYKKIRLVHDLLKLHFAEERRGPDVDVIEVTPNHPFRVVGKGWVVAGDLAVGNSIVTRAGPPVVITKIEQIHSDKPIVVYNFTIADDHTYFVGSANGGEWVHNYSGSPPRITPGSLPPGEEQDLNTALQNIDNGTQPPGTNKWDVNHWNREGNLPGTVGPNPDGTAPYREYYTPNNGGNNRVVVDPSSGNAYYKWNHYGDNATGPDDPPFVQVR